MKSLRLPALAAALLLAACSSPTPTDPAAVAGPSFDGGNTFGSGNYTGETEDGGGMLGSGNITGASTESDTTQRGPGMMGSGN